MQDSDADPPVLAGDPPPEQETISNSDLSDANFIQNGEEKESVFDVSGKKLEFSSFDGADETIESLYLYKNIYSLIPRSVGGLRRLKTLKFFANEINLLPASSEFRNLVELECLQVKLSSPGLNGLPLNNLKGLKELELFKVPPRPSAFPVLTEIAGLKRLTKLSVCHFSIRYLPPEIGCLTNLQHLDLSFNKMKSLPIEISSLKALISLKVANNKLVELPSHLSSLQKLETLDLSNNRLTSLGSLELGSMHNLQSLHLQHNRLPIYFQIPSWIHCNLEGNGQDTSNDEYFSSTVEMDVLEGAAQEIDETVSCNGSSMSSSSLSTSPSSNNRCFASRRLGKGWKRRYYLQQKARQERLNNSRKWKNEDHGELKVSVEGRSGNVGLDDDNKNLPSGKDASINLSNNTFEDDDISSKKDLDEENCSCVDVESVLLSGESVSDGVNLSDEVNEKDEKPSSEAKSSPTCKRHCDRDLDNPKPSKSRRPSDYQTYLSRKYSSLSFCSTDDCLQDGFYDAGRERPFMPLQSYEQNHELDSREVILVDRKQDEELDAIAVSAQSLVFRWKQLHRNFKERAEVVDDDLQIASLLALFVSDHFGGSDRSAIVERTRKSVSGSNYQKPFVCSCSTGNNDTIRTPDAEALNNVDDIVFLDLCEKSLRSIKARRQSIVVPIGTLQFGVCRHRALLMKYLCDRMEPPVPCELVRGYLDFLPHAWNSILIKRGDSWVRMVVDACRPHDIREEMDPEYFCRYIPLSRINLPLRGQSAPVVGCSFPSLSTCDEIEKESSSSLFRCKFGSVEAVAKVRTLEVCGASVDEIKKFEFTCLGEVRILGALKKHSCIVEMFGHQISSKWAPSFDGNFERRTLQSAILMEYIQGGSVKNYIDKLSKASEKHVPVELALSIARDVASALTELHSKHIIHRDIKSENILIDLDRKGANEAPVVKLCDFDRAVPLRSLLHTCCIAHVGIPSPDVCVGTPRWMAPEVVQAMHKRCIYGLEVDIWSFGCLLFELLTLQVPYSGISESEIYDCLQRGERPQLTEELEALRVEEPAMAQSSKETKEPEDEPNNASKALRFLVDLFRRCTVGNPNDRPTAENLYSMLLSHTSSSST